MLSALPEPIDDRFVFANTTMWSVPFKINAESIDPSKPIEVTSDNETVVPNSLLLFNVPLGPERDLDSAQLSDALRQKFEENRHTLSDEAYATVLAPGEQWLVVDTTRRYDVVKGSDALKISLRNIEIRQLASRGELSITPTQGGIGTPKITVTATELSGTKSSQSFRIEVTDSFGRNDSVSFAYDLGFVGRGIQIDPSLHSEKDKDYFTMTAAADGQLEIALRPLGLGQFGMAIVDEMDNVLVESHEYAGLQALSIPVSFAKKVHLRVQTRDQNAPATGKYSLVINGPELRPDLYDVDANKNNDTMPAATKLTTGAYGFSKFEGTILPRDEDWFKWKNPSERATLVVDLRFDQRTGGDLELEVFKNGDVVAFSSRKTSNESI
jgi:hypothetical protein